MEDGDGYGDEGQDFQSLKTESRNVDHKQKSEEDTEHRNQWGTTTQAGMGGHHIAKARERESKIYEEGKE